MRTINIQFHMLFDELIDVVVHVANIFPMSIELERWHPEVTRKVAAGGDLHLAVREFGKVDRIWLCIRAPRSRNEDKLMLNVGTLRENRLQQAQFGGGTKNTDVFAILNGVAAEFKRRTLPGVWTVSESGHIGFSKRFRVSKGAADASRKGVLELTGVGSTQLFRVDAPGNAEGNAKNAKGT